MQNHRQNISGKSFIFSRLNSWVPAEYEHHCLVLYTVYVLDQMSHSTRTSVCHPQKKDKCRGKGKGRRCCLVDRIYSIPCCASYFATDDLKNWMNSSFSLYHPGAIYPILHVVLVQKSQRGKDWNTICPPNSSDDVCLFFCINPSSMVSPSMCKWQVLLLGCFHTHTHTNVLYIYIYTGIFLIG